MRAAVLCCSSLALIGCGFSSPAGSGDAGPPLDPDAPSDPHDAPIDACVTFASQLDTCAHPSGTPLVLTESALFDTDELTLTTPQGPLAVTATHVTTTTDDVELGVLFVERLELGPSVRLSAVGSRPFAIVSRGAIVLRNSAVISVAAGGAGARMQCDGGPSPGANSNGGAAGGGGGGFGGAGGRGGNGNSDAIGGQSQGGAGGMAQPTPEGLLGGCPGARGGNSNDDGGPGGAGGGAVYVVSATSIDLSPASGVDAGGAGGGGGAHEDSTYGDAGGGGGGSGGMIFVEAPRIRGGTLAANGGGGGEASGNADRGNPGAPGGLGAAQAAGGGGNSGTGSDGGLGGAGAIRDGESPTSVQNGGGGGGGGGVGYIRILSPDALVDVVSPDATPS